MRPTRSERHPPALRNLPAVRYRFAPTIYDMTSSTPPIPAAGAADGQPAVASGDWPDRLRVLLLSAALELAGPHDRDAVLQRIVRGAASVADSRYAALGVYDDAGQLATFVHHGFDESTVAAIGHYPEGRGLLGQVIIAERPVRLDDLGSDPSSCGFPEGHRAMDSFLGVPIVRAGRRYGNLYVTEKRGGAPFDETDESLVVALAAFAAGAIETTELVASETSRAAAEERVRSRRDLLGHIIAAQEAERARVSRDLHDDIGQALTSVLLGLRLVEGSLAGPDVDAEDARRRLVDLRELVADGIRRTRELAFDLRPTVLDDIGLVPALHRLKQDLTARTGQRIELDTAALFAEERLPADRDRDLPGGARGAHERRTPRPRLDRQRDPPTQGRAHPGLHRGRWRRVRHRPSA